MNSKTPYSLMIDEQIEPFCQEIPTKNVQKLPYDTIKYEIHIKKQDEQKYGIKQGKYVCIQTSKTFVYLNKAKDFVANELSKVLNKFLKQAKFTQNQIVLVAGMGNGDVACDSLGNLVTSRLLATEYLPEELKKELGNLCFVNCGVGGKTGISSFDVLMGVKEKVKPNIIIMVDSLLTTDVKKIGTCFQVFGNSLIPGGGVGNSQEGFNKLNLDGNVISVGVPLLIQAKSLGKVKKGIEEMFFTPKEVDFYARRCSQIIADAINQSVHKSGYKKFF